MIQQASAMGPRDNNDEDGVTAAVDEVTDTGVDHEAAGKSGPRGTWPWPSLVKLTRFASRDEISDDASSTRRSERAVASPAAAAKSVRRKESASEKPAKHRDASSGKRSAAKQRSADAAASLRMPHGGGEGENGLQRRNSAASKEDGAAPLLQRADSGSGSGSRKSSLQRTDSERSSTKRKGKKISPPDSTPEIAGGVRISLSLSFVDNLKMRAVFAGILDVTLSPKSRWRRRYLTVQSGQIFIFPRPESKVRTYSPKVVFPNSVLRANIFLTQLPIGTDQFRCGWPSHHVGF